MHAAMKSSQEEEALAAAKSSSSGALTSLLELAARATFYGGDNEGGVLAGDDDLYHQNATGGGVGGIIPGFAAPGGGGHRRSPSASSALAESKMSAEEMARRVLRDDAQWFRLRIELGECGFLTTVGVEQVLHELVRDRMEEMHEREMRRRRASSSAPGNPQASGGRKGGLGLKPWLRRRGSKNAIEQVSQASALAMEAMDATEAAAEVEECKDLGLGGEAMDNPKSIADVLSKAANLSKLDEAGDNDEERDDLPPLAEQQQQQQTTPSSSHAQASASSSRTSTFVGAGLVGMKRPSAGMPPPPMNPSSPVTSRALPMTGGATGLGRLKSRTSRHSIDFVTKRQTVSHISKQTANQFQNQVTAVAQQYTFGQGAGDENRRTKACCAAGPQQYQSFPGSGEVGEQHLIDLVRQNQAEEGGDDKGRGKVRAISGKQSRGSGTWDSLAMEEAGGGGGGLASSITGAIAGTARRMRSASGDATSLFRLGDEQAKVKSSKLSASKQNKLTADGDSKHRLGGCSDFNDSSLFEAAVSHAAAHGELPPSNEPPRLAQSGAVLSSSMSMHSNSGGGGTAALATSFLSRSGHGLSRPRAGQFSRSRSADAVSASVKASSSQSSGGALLPRDSAGGSSGSGSPSHNQEWQVCIPVIQTLDVHRRKDAGATSPPPSSPQRGTAMSISGRPKKSCLKNSSPGPMQEGEQLLPDANGGMAALPYGASVSAMQPPPSSSQERYRTGDDSAIESPLPSHPVRSLTEEMRDVDLPVSSSVLACSASSTRQRPSADHADNEQLFHLLQSATQVRGGNVGSVGGGDASSESSRPASASSAASVATSHATVTGDASLPSSRMGSNNNSLASLDVPDNNVDPSPGIDFASSRGYGICLSAAEEYSRQVDTSLQSAQGSGPPSAQASGGATSDWRERMARGCGSRDGKKQGGAASRVEHGGSKMHRQHQVPYSQRRRPSGGAFSHPLL